MPDSHAVFDLETTGLSPQSAVITEIGWLICKDGISGAARSLLVNCGQPVPAEVAAITGITTELLEAEGVPLAEALAVFLQETDGLRLAGHNVCRFDAPFLEAACRAAALPPPDRSRYVDTAALFVARCLDVVPATGAAHFAWATDLLSRRRPGLRYNLGACCDALVIERSDVTAHRAAADVTLTARLYAALLAGSRAEVRA